MDDSELSYGYSRDIYHGRRGPGGHYGTPVKSYDAGRFYPDQPHHQGSYEHGGLGDQSFPRRGGYGPEEGMIRTFDGPPYPGRGDAGSAGREDEAWNPRGPYAGLGPKGYRRADERIEEDVCERLQAHGAVDASQIEVQVDEGEVTLEGTVRTRRMKKLAEAVADTVTGVVDVHNRLRLEAGQPAS